MGVKRSGRWDEGKFEQEIGEELVNGPVMRKELEMKTQHCDGVMQ